MNLQNGNIGNVNSGASNLMVPLEASTVQTFDFDLCDVRVFMVDDKPHFVGRDVAMVLEYADPGKAIREHTKGGVIRPIPTAGGIQQMIVIPERDVYRLVMRSKMPRAEQFEEWVVGVVIPSIRQTGSYAMPKAPTEPAGNSSLALARHLLEALEEQDRVNSKRIAEVNGRVNDAHGRIDDMVESQDAFEQRMTMSMSKAPLAAVPADMEHITAIKVRMNERYGLPGDIVAFIMRESDYKLVPAATVISEHAEDFRAPPFCVYHIAVVSSIFSRFVKECVRVDDRKATHHFLPGRKFNLSPAYGKRALQ